MEGIQEEEGLEFDFGADTNVDGHDALDDLVAVPGSAVSSEEATSNFDLDDEVSFVLPESTQPQVPAASVCPTIQVPKPVIKINAKPSLRDRLASSVTEVTNNRGLIESICSLIIVEGTPLHDRIEKKASTLAGATAKLISIDPEFKILCKNFADNFESYSGVVLKSRVLELLDILQDTYELTDDQAALSVLMFCTSRLRKRGDKSLQNAAMTMRILGSVVSVSDSELSARFSKLEDGILEGDLSGGDRSGVIRFATGHESDCSSRTFVSWLGFMSHLAEYDSALVVEKKKFFMIPSVRHLLWQQISPEGRLENIQVCFARFLEAHQTFKKFQTILNIDLLPSDAFGLISLFWPAMFKDFKAEIKAAVRLSVSSSSAPIRWLLEIPVFKTIEEYEILFRLAWNLYTAGGDRLVAVKDRPSAAPAGGSAPAVPAPADKSAKVCPHFRKFGICKFGDDKKCRNGLHPDKFKKAGGTPVPALPAPAAPAVLPAGDSEDAIVRDCRRCKKAFTESFVYWTTTLKMESMPWHCDICRALNRDEKKALKASNVTAAIPASVPLIEIPGADSGDASTDADANHWDEILHWDDDQCDVNLMICAASSHGGPDHAWKVDHNQVVCKHPDVFCPNGYPVIDFVNNVWCDSCGLKIESRLLDHATCDEECGCQRSSGDELDLTSSPEKSEKACDVADNIPVWSPDTWKADLDDNGLAVTSISAKTSFCEDVKHFDRICCHLKTHRFIQICVADKEYLLAVDSEDMIELCIPGSSIGSSDPISLSSLPLLLFEQTGIDVDLSRFKFLGYAELSDQSDIKSVWFYFEISSEVDDEFSEACTEEGNPVSWLEPFQWSTMNDLRAAESSVYFDLKRLSLQNGIEVDTLDSAEFEYAMGSSPDVADIPGVSSKFSSLRCRTCDGDGSDHNECDGTLCEFGNCSACCGEFGCDCITFETPDESEEESVDSNLAPDFDFGSSEKFGQIIEHVLSYGFISESMDNLHAVWSGRFWSVRQPAAKKAVRSILAATEICTSVQRIGVLSSLVPLALSWIRQGCPEEDLASALASDRHKESEYSGLRANTVDTSAFSAFDFEVVASAAIGLAVVASGKQRVVVVASLTLDLSKLASVCSGLHRDVKSLTVDYDIAADARKAGVMKQLTLRESLARASRSVMFSEPSYSYVKTGSKNRLTGTEALADADPFFGHGSTEPRE